MLQSVSQRRWLPCIVLAGLLLRTGSSVLAQEGLFNVADLDRLSKLIVVGTISGGVDGQLSLVVDRVLKGSATANSIISVAWTPAIGNGCDTTQPTAQTHAIWFLDKASDGAIKFAPFMNSQLCHPSHPDYETSTGPLNAGLTYKPSDTAGYKLAIELASTLLNSTTIPVAVQHYPGIFGGLNATQTERIGELLHGSSNDDVRKIGDLNLIMTGNPVGLELLTSWSLEIAQAPTGSTESTSQNSEAASKWQLVKAITEIRSTSTSTVVALAQIATNKGQDLQIRRAASRSLRNIHTIQAVVAAAPLMDDPDSLISTYALSTLACYANAIPVLDDTVPGHNLDLNREGPFKSNNTLAHFVIGPMGSDAAEKIAFWRQWWESHKASIQQAADAAQ